MAEIPRKLRLGGQRYFHMAGIRKSIELRLKAVEALRKARALPKGAERDELRQIALAYKALSENEAWLAGELPKRRS